MSFIWSVGDKGDVGDTGPKGAPGIEGAKGEKGAFGDQVCEQLIIFLCSLSIYISGLRLSIINHHDTMMQGRFI